MEKRKIFAINHSDQKQTDWVAAYTNIEALRIFRKETDIDLWDYEDEDEITEVPVEEWPNLVVINDDKSETKFDQWMKENPSCGLIASTAY